MMCHGDLRLEDPGPHQDEGELHIFFVLIPTFEGGRFRKENLELLPFALAPPLCVGKDPSWSSATLGLWKLPLSQVTMCSRVRSATFGDNENGPQTYYSCT